MSFVAALPYVGLGAAAGAVHFLLLGRSILLVTSGEVVKAASVQLARLALTLAALAAVALSGWAPLLACAVGFLAARLVVVPRLARRWP